MNKLTKEQEIEICKRYLNGENSPSISIDYPITRQSVCFVLDRNGIKRRKNFESNHSLSKKEELEIIDKYKNKQSASIIAKEYSVSLNTIIRTLNRNNIEIRSPSEESRKYEINENYFDEIDNQDKAYFLGFLYADGCNMTDRKCIILALQEPDREILIKLNSLLQLSKPVRFYKKRYNNLQNTYKLIISNKHISEMLAKHGVVKAKTFKLLFPEWLREDLIPHFIRGYFDGDGCLYCSKKLTYNMCIDIVSTESFCISVAKYLKEKININCYIRTANPKSDNRIKEMKSCGRDQVTKFLKLIYKDANLYLKRKKDKADSIINNPIPIQVKNRIGCIVIGCKEKHHSKGYCRKHYSEYMYNKNKLKHIN